MGLWIDFFESALLCSKLLRSTSSLIPDGFQTKLDRETRTAIESALLCSTLLCSTSSLIPTASLLMYELILPFQICAFRFPARSGSHPLGALGDPLGRPLEPLGGLLEPLGLVFATADAEI